VFDIACTGIAKEDLEIQTQSNTLRVNYDKTKSDDKGVEYIHRGIAKRSFNLGWKIDSKFDLSKANAEFKYGLLKITIPFAKGSELKTLAIK
jgi:HSP20 family molecular chaperone IbpA